MILREAGENELIPSVVKEGKPAKDFEPDFFIVSIAHGQPKQGVTDYNILKNYDFSVPNRDKQQKRQDFKDYIKRHKGDLPAKRFANFHMLLYLAELMDPDTSLTIAYHVAEEKPLDEALNDLLQSM